MSRLSQKQKDSLLTSKKSVERTFDKLLSDPKHPNFRLCLLSAMISLNEIDSKLLHLEHVEKAKEISYLPVDPKSVLNRHLDINRVEAIKVLEMKLSLKKEGKDRLDAIEGNEEAKGLKY